MTTSRKHGRKTKLTAAEFDRAFERGEGFEALDLETATVRAPMQRINIDLPKHILGQLNEQAKTPC